MAKPRQLLLLTWKNFKLQFRHPWVTLLELGVPAFFSLCLVLIRSAISSEQVLNPVLYDPFSIDSLPQNLTPTEGKKWEVLYSPQSPFLENIMDNVATSLDVNTTGFSTEDQMIDYFSKYSSFVLSGIVFNERLINGTDNTRNITYTIRPKTAEGGNSAFKNTLQTWFTHLTFPIFPVLGPRNRDSAWGGSPGYMSQGFLPLQQALANSFMAKLASETFQSSTVEMRRYPFPPYLDDKFVIALQLFFPMIICFSFIYPSTNIVKNIVIEKERRLKEAMKMMGLGRWMHWTAWYLKYLVFLLLSSAIMTLLLCIKFDKDVSVINTSDPSVIFVWLLTYSASIIAFAFLLSTLFNKANSAAAGAGVIFFLTFVPYFFILPRYNDMGFITKMVSCLIPNVAIAMGSIVLTVAEASGYGLQWSNIGHSASPDDTLSLSSVVLMLLLDCVIFLFLTWYLEAVFPGEYGVPERWYFPFTRSYWLGPSHSYSDMVQLFNSSVKRSEFFENDPPDLLAGIQIQGLTKVYGKKKIPAVNNMSVNMYRGQVTVLLGHNGAGKSTTISMLTGLITPNSGTATLNGFDICEDMSSVHSNLGICPQHDVLFDELTVEEHLYFFCKLKGYISDLVKSEVNRVLSALHLEEARDAQAHTLSGGWRRRLSVAIALVGGSRVVILDEPSTGLDPVSRRFLWSVLESEKEDRTILLTTHSMEEAEVLADRIAIMAEGEIQCCGSTMFLKKKYGCGYHLVLVKGAGGCDVRTVGAVVSRHVPPADLASDLGSELKFILPREFTSSFPALFEELERRRLELDIAGFGASITTLEEVFIKVGRKVNQEDVIELDLNYPFASKTSLSPADSGVHINEAFTDDSGVTEVRSECPSVCDEEVRHKGWRLWFHQLSALLWKRILHTLRNRALTLSQLAMPPLFLILTLVMVKTLPKMDDGPNLLLTLDSYRGTQVPYTSDKSTLPLAGVFASQFTGHQHPIFLNSTVQNLTDYLLAEANRDLEEYNHHNMMAAEFSTDRKTKVAAWFNNQAYHSPAIALLQVHRALLANVTNGSYDFAISNHPLPRTLAQKGKQQQTEQTESYQIAQDIMFGMSFLVASFAVFVVKERASRCRHLQRASGLNLAAYWLAAFAWDLLNYLVPCCLLMAVFAAFGTEGLKTSEQQGRLFLVFLIHGFSALPFVYCCTFMFQTPSTAYVRLSLFNILIGIACLLTVNILEIPDLGTTSVAKPLDIVFSLAFPNFGLGRAVSNLYQNYQFNQVCGRTDVQTICRMGIEPFFDYAKPCCKGKCDSVCIPWEEDYFSVNTPGVGKQLICFALQSLIFVFLLYLCERNVFRQVRYRVTQSVAPLALNQSAQEEEEDGDVVTERERVLRGHDSPCTEPVVLRLVTRTFGAVVAVDRLTVSVRKGECFGLLGPNGAGKTTTFRMITGDESLSSGDIFVNGWNVKTDIRKAQRTIGYCPQYDALIDELTGRETIALFARLRGIPEDKIGQHSALLTQRLALTPHIDKQVKEYSGGNKRKLSTAIALLGDPPVIFLDEPTSGMDPVSRRCVWNAILQVVHTGRSLVLTSHSMEECEALCSRLVILVKGRAVCLGSPQHLKSKFGRGFSLLVRARPGRPIEARVAVEHVLPSAVLRSSHGERLHFHVPGGRPWSQVFRALEETRAGPDVEDYSVGETSLEQVFLNFADQMDE